MALGRRDLRYTTARRPIPRVAPEEDPPIGMPFMWVDIVRLAIWVAFPIISLWLPSLMR